MDEVKSIIHMYGEPNSVQERCEHNITVRTDLQGCVIIEGETSSIKHKLRTMGGIWSPRSRQWSFQEVSIETVKAFLNDMIKDGSCDTKIIELTWDSPIPISPNQPTEKLIPRNIPHLSPFLPFQAITEKRLDPRRFTGEIARDVLDALLFRNNDGKIISISGIPLPGVASAKEKCDLCSASGHTRIDCICPFCRYIGLHNPMNCASRPTASQ